MIVSIRSGRLLLCSVLACAFAAGCGDDTGTGGAGGDPPATGGAPDTGGAPPTGEGGGGGGASLAMCQDAFDHIEQITTALACVTPKAAEFKSTCEATLTSKPECADLLQAFIDCAIAAPQADWECDGNGQANLAGATCDTQEAAIQTCAR